MIPIPNSKVFRSRRGALWWSFWVIIGAVMTVGFGPAASKHPKAEVATDATGEEVNQADLAVLAAVGNAQ